MKMTKYVLISFTIIIAVFYCSEQEVEYASVTWNYEEIVADGASYPTDLEVKWLYYSIKRLRRSISWKSDFLYVAYEKSSGDPRFVDYAVVKISSGEGPRGD